MLRGMTGWVLGAMLLGIAVGLALHAKVPDPATLTIASTARWACWPPSSCAPSA